MPRFSRCAVYALIKQSPAAPAAETDYTYDLAGNLASIQVSDQPAAVTYGYDNLNRVNSVTDQRGTTTTFGYNNVDQRTTTSYPNGVTMKQVYDSSHRLTCIYSYTGTRQAVTGTSVPNATTSYGHTADNALCWSAPGAVTGTCSSPPAGATTYSFDNAGNLASTSNGLSASYNLQNQNSQLARPAASHLT